MKWRDFIPPILQTKANRVNQMITAYLLGEPIWTEMSLENMAKEGLNKNVWVYRCIMEIAKAGSDIPLVLYRRDSQGELQEIKNHPLLQLIWNPNQNMSKQEFMENLLAYTQLTGNAYFHHTGPKAKPPQELWILRPDRMKVIPGGLHLVAGYEHAIGEKKQVFEPNLISHVKLFSALDDFYGLSPIQVAARSIDSDNFANSWNASLFQNGARPSGAMVTEGTLGDNEYNRLQKAIEKQYSGAKNAGKPMLLEGGLDWKEMSLSPQEMDFIQSKSLNRLEICSAFGVPPEIVGDHEHATYSNYQEARKSFYQDTVLPMVNKVIDIMNKDLVSKFGDNLFLAVNQDEIDALQEDRDKVFTRAINAVSAGILEVNEGREAMGYEAKEGGNVRYVPTSVMPEGEDAPDLSALMGTGESQQGEKSRKMEWKALNPRNTIEKKQYWRSFDRMRAGFYGSAGKQVAKRFKAEKDGVMKAFEDGGEEEVMEYLEANQKEWNKTLKAIYIAVMERFGESVFDSLMGNQKNDIPDYQIKDEHDENQDEEEPMPTFNVYHESVQSFISSTVANKVVKIDEGTRTKLKATIRRGFDNGLTLYEVRDEIEKLYLDQIIPNRSLVIARTEVIGASNAGSRQAAKQTGLKLRKEWVATADDRTRESHEEADGQIKEMDEPFEVGSSYLMYPGDPEGGGDEVIQCRCTEVYHTE